MMEILFLRPSLHFNTLHSTSLHLSTLHFFPFKIHPTTLYYTSLPSHLAKPHQNFLPLNFTSHHCTSTHVEQKWRNNVNTWHISAQVLCS